MHFPKRFLYWASIEMEPIVIPDTLYNITVIKYINIFNMHETQSKCLC